MFPASLYHNQWATTSSKPIVPSCIFILRLGWFLTTTSCVSIPTNENCKVWLSNTSTKVKFPYKSVIAPLKVPLTITVTPGKGSPFISVTLPEIVFFDC